MVRLVLALVLVGSSVAHADVEDVDSSGWTALMRAAEGGKTAEIIALLDHGAKLEASNPKVYGGATHRLDDCYRCSQEALDSGEKLLVATQPGREPRTLRSANLSRPPAIVVAREGDAVDEAFFCAREIKLLYAESHDLRLSDFAIVLRSTTWLGGPFEEALRALGFHKKWGREASGDIVRLV